MTPLINGTNYSWGNIQMLILGTMIVGITKISYKEKQEKKNNYGAQNKPVSRGYGNVEPEGSIEIYLDEWKRIIDRSPNRDPLQIPPFDVTVIYGGKNVPPTKDVLKSVEFLENPFDGSQGDTRLLVTIPLIIGGIER